jgi:hypothetical protein
VLLIGAEAGPETDGVAEREDVAGADTGPLVQASVEPGPGSRSTSQMPGNRSSLRQRGHLARRLRWGLASLVLVGFGVASADPVPPARSVKLRAASDLDGLHVWLGPIGAATHVENQWDSAWGGTIAVIRIREHARVGAIGGWLGAAHYAVRDGGRVWLDGVVGTRRLGGHMLGAGVGPVLELGDLRHPNGGAQATFWCFAGVVPYARLGVLEASGSFVEVGISLSVPAIRF